MVGSINVFVSDGNFCNISLLRIVTLDPVSIKKVIVMLSRRAHMKYPSSIDQFRRMATMLLGPSNSVGIRTPDLTVGSFPIVYHNLSENVLFGCRVDWQQNFVHYRDNFFDKGSDNLSLCLAFD